MVHTLDAVETPPAPPAPAGGPFAPALAFVNSIGFLYGSATLFAMFAGMPIAFALGAVATVFTIAFMTIAMELGLIHPPVGLNLFVIKSMAPDIPLRDMIWGVLPLVALMIFAVVVLCIFPGIATTLADAVMGR